MFVYLDLFAADANKGSQTNPGHFKEFGFSKLNKSNHAQVQALINPIILYEEEAYIITR